MSIQIQSSEPSEITKPAVVSQSNIVSMNGQKREVERIRIEDLSGHLDKEIQKIELEKEPVSKKALMFAIAFLVTYTIAVVGYFLALSNMMFSNLALGLVVSGNVLGLPLLLFALNSSKKLFEYELKFHELEYCKSNLQKPEFLYFAKKMGGEFTVDELLVVRRAYVTDLKTGELIKSLHWKNNQQLDSLKFGLNYRMNQFI